MIKIRLIVVGSVFLLGLIVLLFVLVFTFHTPLKVAEKISFFNHSHNPKAALPPPETSFLLVGDVMLARDVEIQMALNGRDYPFENIKNLLSEHDYVVGNFEGSVPQVHRPTPSMAFQFSVPVKNLPALKTAGFTHFSLANNHSFDFGLAGYQNASRELEQVGLEVFGRSGLVEAADVSFVEVDGRKIAFVGIDLTLMRLSETELSDTFADINQVSDLQIVFVHWGIEYDITHSPAQQNYAELFIDQGADLVIGHHPHVVQDIGVYKDKLIFYSLGNFIFDQYFSFDVKHGLAASLILSQDAKIDLFPVTTEASKASPYLLEEAKKGIFLEKLADNSDALLRDSIYAGSIKLSPDLAVSP